MAEEGKGRELEGLKGRLEGVRVWGSRGVWKDGSEVKSTCSSRGPWFTTRRSHEYSQISPGESRNVNHTGLAPQWSK